MRDSLKKEDTLGVSLVYYLCPICGKRCDSGIIMNSLLTEKNAKEVRKLNNQNIGYADHTCEECSKYDAVFFVGIDESKSTAKEPYRTGHLVGIKKDSPLVEKCKKYLITLKEANNIAILIITQVNNWDYGNSANQ